MGPVVGWCVVCGGGDEKMSLCSGLSCVCENFINKLLFFVITAVFSDGGGVG